SDGLSDLVSLEDMERIIAEAADDEAAVYALWRAAMDATGRDNISILLARRNSGPRPSAPGTREGTPGSPRWSRRTGPRGERGHRLHPGLTRPSRRPARAGPATRPF